MNDGHSYDWSHAEIATPLEREEVERQKPDDPNVWKKYEEEIDGYGRGVDDETITRVAPDQDLRQFAEDDRELLRRIIAAEGHGVHDAIPGERHGSVDPTGTSALRQKFRRDLDARWLQLRRLIASAFAPQNDILGLCTVPIAPDHSGVDPSLHRLPGSDRVEAFRNWLDERLRQIVMAGDGKWVDPYLMMVTRKATQRAEALTGVKVRDAFDPDEPRDPHGQWTQGEADERWTESTYDNKRQILLHAGKEEVGEISIIKRADDNFEVSNVLVWPKHQRKGYATKLYRRAFELARRHQRRLFISNDRTPDAVRLHEIFVKRGILRPTGEVLFGDAQVKDAASSIDDRSSHMSSLTASELRGICAAVSQQATRALAHGLQTRQRPAKIAREIAARIDAVGKTRGHMLVNYAVVKAFNGASLDAFRQAGFKKVGTIPEKLRVARGPHGKHLVRDEARISPQRRHGRTGQFIPFQERLPSGKQSRIERQEGRIAELRQVEVLTAGDDLVCQVCQDISDDGPYDIDTAEGLIPAHLNCRCVFVPSLDLRFAPVHDAFDPDEERDERGRWAGGGGGEGEREKIIMSMHDFAKKSHGSLRERVVVMRRTDHKVLADYEQELELDVPSLTHQAKATSGFSNADMFNEKGEYHPDNLILHLHTHPIDQSFSDGDWRIFARSTIGEMRVVTPEKEFILTKTPEFNSLPWQERTPAAINKAYSKILDDISDERLKSPTDSNGKWVDEVIDKTSAKMAEHFKVKYAERHQ